MINIGNAFKEHRLICGYTQTELAKATGIKQQNISRWESNTHNPDILDCIKLANFYGISLEELLGLENELNFNYYTPSTPPSLLTDEYSDEEKMIIKEYRKLPETSKELFKRICGIQEKVTKK